MKYMTNGVGRQKDKKLDGDCEERESKLGLESVIKD